MNSNLNKLNELRVNNALLKLAGLAGLAIAVLASAQGASAAGPGICQNNNALSCSSNTDCGGNPCYLPTAGGQTLSNQACVQTAAGSSLNCNTANDVNVAQTSSL